MLLSWNWLAVRVFVPPGWHESATPALPHCFVYNKAGMKDHIVHHIQDQTFVLSRHKAAYWEQGNTLLISDLHLGKLPLTSTSTPAHPSLSHTLLEPDLLRLSDLIYDFKPQRLLLLGDLFHKTFTSEWHYVQIWRNQFEQMEIELVLGNHDLLPAGVYQELNMKIIPRHRKEDIFLFSHRPVDSLISDRIVVCGHLHPAVTLIGKGDAEVTLPCFYFGNHHCILPAFSNAVRTTEIQPNRGDSVYVVTNKMILAV